MPSTTSPQEKDANEDKFAPFHYPTGVWVNGVQVPRLPMDKPAEQHIEDIREMEIRDDDILIAAYPKSGTHWVWEIVTMLTKGTTDHATIGKEFTMLEFCPISLVDEHTSPRILNSHLYMAHLPKEIFKKKTKILHLVRNPKDVLLSMYHHFGHYASFTLQDLMEVYMEGKMAFTNQFEFLRQMSNFQMENPDHPVKTVYYEDLKKNPAKCIKEIAEFLGLPSSEALCDDIAKACDFKKMKNFDKSKEMPKPLTEFREKAIGQERLAKLQLFRKGVVGDWKNEFTVAQNEVFDAFIQKQEKDLNFNFTYGLDI